jgi:hypothetical protein
MADEMLQQRRVMDEKDENDRKTAQAFHRRPTGRTGILQLEKIDEAWGRPGGAHGCDPADQTHN